MPLKTNPCLPRAVSSFGIARVGSRIYVAGGHSGREHAYSPSDFSNETYYFDIASSEWNRAGIKHAATQGFQLVHRRNGDKDYLYALGGLIHDPYAGDANWTARSLNAIERLDVDNGTWEMLTGRNQRLPRRRSSYGVGQLGDSVYLLGGWDRTSGTFHKEIDVFNLSSETVEATDFALGKEVRAFSSVSFEDEIIMVGGLGPQGHVDLRADVISFRPNAAPSDQWEPLPSLPKPTFAPASVIVSETLFVFGGMTTDARPPNTYSDQIVALDLRERKEWVSPSEVGLSIPRSFIGALPIGKKEIALVGGHPNPTKDDVARSPRHPLGWPTNIFEVYSV